MTVGIGVVFKDTGLTVDSGVGKLIELGLIAGLGIAVDLGLTVAIATAVGIDVAVGSLEELISGLIGLG